MVVIGQGGGGGMKAFFKQWYMVYTLQTDVEFTSNYQMIPHNPF